jgi:hypothetical protein
MWLSILGRYLGSGKAAPRRRGRRRLRRAHSAPGVRQLEHRNLLSPAPVPSGILSWWPGDDNAADLVGSNGGTLNGNVGYYQGQVGDAFQFDGTDYVSAPTTGLPTGNADRTIEMWVKVNAFATTESFFAGYGNFGSTEETYQVGTLEDGTLFFSQWGQSFNGPALQAGKWYHVAVTSVGNAETLYLNGVSVATGSLTLNTPTGSSLYIGRIPGALGDTRQLDGEVDEVSVYNRALSATEIDAIYQAGDDGKRKPYMIVDTSSPSEGDVVATPPTHFTIEFSNPIDASSLQASALTVNGTPADSVSLVNPYTAGFDFNSSPVTGGGLQTMQMAAGAVHASNHIANPSLVAWSKTFSYQPPADQWTGANFAVDTNWSDGANWSLGAPPSAGQNVLFTSNASVKDFTSTVDAGFTNAIAGLNIDSSWGGTITVNSPLSVTGDFTLASGTFGGSGAVTIGGRASHWNGGQIDLGSGGLTNTGTLNANTAGGNLVLNGAGILTNEGTIDLAGTNSVILEGTATLDNTAGATLDITGNGSVGQSGGGTLTSAGTLEKTGGTGTSTIASSFINSGAITVTKGTLALASAGGTSTGGTFKVARGATLDLTGGASVAYGGTYTGTGQGTVALSAGTLAVARGGATFDMAGALFQWTGGTIDVAKGSFTNTGTINYSGSANVVLAGAHSLVNRKHMLQTSTGTLLLENGATLDNTRAGLYNLDGDGGIGETGTSALVNAGTLEKSAGTGTSTIATSTLSNTGSIEVGTGTLDVTATVSQVSGGTLTAGSWTVTGSATVTSTLDIASAGSLTTLGSGATVTLNGLNTTFSNLGGLSTIDSGAGFSLLGGQSFTTSGALTNAGVLTLGPGSVLTVSGGFTQQSTGTLTVGMGGTDTAPTIGQLVSTTGSVSLAGSLNVVSTVVPSSGSQIELLDNEGNTAISGTFAGLAAGSSFKVTVGGTTMTFVISYTGPDGDGNQNVVITRVS